jgi:hypothetical protein
VTSIFYKFIDTVHGSIVAIQAHATVVVRRVN